MPEWIRVQDLDTYQKSVGVSAYHTIDHVPLQLFTICPSRTSIHRRWPASQTPRRRSQFRGPVRMVLITIRWTSPRPSSKNKFSASSFLLYFLGWQQWQTISAVMITSIMGVPCCGSHSIVGENKDLLLSSLLCDR